MLSVRFFIIYEIAIIAFALVSGVFRTFSDFVMRSLDGAKRNLGIEGMQVINREVYRSIFMFLLLGMSALSPALAVYSYLHIAGSTSTLVIAGLGG